jgi:beta-lactamase class A
MHLRSALPLLVALVPLPLTAMGCATSDPDTATSEPQLVEGDAVVNVDRLNFRDGPSTNDGVIQLLAEGTRVRVRSPEVRNGFAPISFNGRDGWAFAEFLTSVATRRSGTLAEVVNGLAGEAPSVSPGTELGIAVMNLSTGESAGAGDDVRHVSASSAKVMWVAAAMHAGAGVSDIGRPIFESSDNFLAGTAIDRAGGIDAVNDFYWNVVGMDHSITANWSFGRPRHATEQGLLGGDNYFTPKNVITFLSRLDAGELVGDRTDELRGLMRLSPRAGFGGWIGTLLPQAARAGVMHKAGWLPPPEFAEYSTLNDVGIVQVPGGERYAIALLARHGVDFGVQGRFVERASCVIYRLISGDGALACRD